MLLSHSCIIAVIALLLLFIIDPFEGVCYAKDESGFPHDRVLGAPDTPSSQPSKIPSSQPSSTPHNQASSKPHIVMVVIDDMGYGDPGFKGSGIKTPTIDGLAQSGTLLKNYYVFPACSHTRTAIMSAKYPYRSAIYSVVNPFSTWGMMSRDLTMANVLRPAGYHAHAIGKWHLGMAWNDYLPTFRGFESFYGFWLNEFYFNHSTHDPGQGYGMHWDKQEFCGWNCSEFADVRGQYSTKVFSDRATELIQNYDTQKGPLFLYLAYQGVHEPQQAPKSYTDPYESSGWPSAKIVYAGMLAAVDEGIAQVIQSLKTKGMWSKTLLIVTTDNGAPISVPGTGVQHGGSNAPLRGAKLQILEGGIRADGIIAGPARVKLGIKGGWNKNMFHATDWLPTLASLVEANYTARKFDGISQARSLLLGEPCRTEAFLGYDVTDRDLALSDMRSAYRIGDMKLVRWRQGVKLQYQLYNLTKDIQESSDLVNKSAYGSLVKTMKNKMKSFDSMFTKVPESLGTCPNFHYGTTPWGQNGWIPWCEAAYNRRQLTEGHSE